MTNTKHTPGPWVVNYEGDVRGADGRTVPWTKDDARLIAAAPDLLAALEGLASACSNPDGTKCPDRATVEHARAAIARAKEEKS